MKIKIKDAIELIANLRQIDQRYSKNLIKELEQVISDQSLNDEIEIAIKQKEIKKPFEVRYDSETCYNIIE